MLKTVCMTLSLLALTIIVAPGPARAGQYYYGGSYYGTSYYGTNYYGTSYYSTGYYGGGYYPSYDSRKVERCTPRWVRTFDGGWIWSVRAGCQQTRW